MLGTSNITTTLVSNELGISTHDISKLCTSPNINMWSRWKPIQATTTSGITEDILTKNNYGISYPIFVSTSSVQDYFDGDQNQWTYSKPTDVYRIGDFRNYKHDAVQILTSVKLPTSGSDTGSTSIIGASAFLNVRDGDIGAEDLFPDGIYFGIIVKRGAIEKYGTGTILRDESSGAAFVTLNIHTLPNGTYDVYPVFCTKEYDNSIYPMPNPPVSQQFIPVPGANPSILTIKSSDMTITLRANKSKTGLIDWTCTIVTEVSRILTTNSVAFRFLNKDFDDPLTTGEYSEVVEDVYVQSGKPYVLTGSYQVTQPSSNYKVWVSFQSATYKSSTVALTPMT